MIDSLISDRARAIDASLVRQLFDVAARQRNVIDFSLGMPDFDVPEPIRKAMTAAVDAGHNRYTQSPGLPALRQRIRRQISGELARDGRWHDFDLIVTAGVNGALVLIVLACVDPGDEVVIGDPSFLHYQHIITLAGGKPVWVDTYPDFQVTAARLEAVLTPRTKLILFNSPANPTGVVADPATCREVAELAKAHNVLLVSDEVYRDFFFQERVAPCPTPASHSDEMLVLRGFSKSHGMTGWRLGYAFGPPTVIEQLTKIQQYTFVCAPSIVQAAVAEACEMAVSPRASAYRGKRDLVVAALSDRYDLVPPQGAFYAFPRVPTNESATDFCGRALGQGLLIVPGKAFSQRDTHFRMSFACADETLRRGLEVLMELARG